MIYNIRIDDFLNHKRLFNVTKLTHFETDKTLIYTFILK